MTSSIKLNEKLEGAENFRTWKDRIMLFLEENDLDGFVENEVPEPDPDHNQNLKESCGALSGGRFKALGNTRWLGEHLGMFSFQF